MMQGTKQWLCVMRYVECWRKSTCLILQPAYPAACLSWFLLPAVPRRNLQPTVSTICSSLCNKHTWQAEALPVHPRLVTHRKESTCKSSERWSHRSKHTRRTGVSPIALAAHLRLLHQKHGPWLQPDCSKRTWWAGAPVVVHPRLLHDRACRQRLLVFHQQAQHLTPQILQGRHTLSLRAVKHAEAVCWAVPRFF